MPHCLFVFVFIRNHLRHISYLLNVKTKYLPFRRVVADYTSGSLLETPTGLPTIRIEVNEVALEMERRFRTPDTSPPPYLEGHSLSG